MTNASEIPGIKIDREWFASLIDDGFTPEEIAARPCVWMCAEEIEEQLDIHHNDIRLEMFKGGLHD